jgi:hypothetical protein
VTGSCSGDPARWARATPSTVRPRSTGQRSWASDDSFGLHLARPHPGCAQSWRTPRERSSTGGRLSPASAPHSVSSVKSGSGPLRPATSEVPSFRACSLSRMFRPSGSREDPPPASDVSVYACPRFPERSPGSPYSRGLWPVRRQQWLTRCCRTGRFHTYFSAGGSRPSQPSAVSTKSLGRSWSSSVVGARVRRMNVGAHCACQDEMISPRSAWSRMPPSHRARTCRGRGSTGRRFTAKGPSGKRWHSGTLVEASRARLRPRLGVTGWRAGG